MPNELARMAHLLLAAAMICDLLEQNKCASHVSGRAAGITIDEADQSVWIDGARIHLSSRAYDLLLGLYQHANRLCTRRQIVEQFLRERYDDTDQSQNNRLNTAISRLRERIEADPNHPRFLITEPGGYRLIPEPGI
jgi:two-component system KDP operon response regulator KdpE